MNNHKKSTFDIKLPGFVTNQKIKNKKNEYENKESSIIFTTKIKFEDLNKIFEISSRMERNRLEDDLDSSQKYEGANQHFQRYTDSKRIKEIKKYLLGETDDKNNFSEHIFPSSIILWPIDEEYYYLNDEKNELTIKKESNEYEPKVLIVDGQHRFSAVMELYKEDININECINKFEFPAVFILNTNIFDMGKLFGYINKFQKPLNSSLFYDIFGSYPGDKSEIAFAHKIVSKLAFGDGFLKNKINMTGSKKSERENKDWLFSQSYFIRFFLSYLKPFEIFREYYLDFETNDSLEGINEIVKFINIYFETIVDVFIDYYNDKTCLTKTNGVGGFLRLLDEFYKIYEKEGQNGIKNKLNQLNDSKFSNKYFDEGSIFSSGGSDGASSKLALYLKIELGFKYTDKEYERYKKYKEKE